MRIKLDFSYNNMLDSVNCVCAILAIHIVYLIKDAEIVPLNFIDTFLSFVM